MPGIRRVGNVHDFRIVEPSAENLDVTTVIYNNGAYDILRIELQRVGAGRILARRPWISLIYRVPQWISSRSPKVWVFLHVVSPPARNSPTPCARPSPSPGRI